MVNGPAIPRGSTTELTKLSNPRFVKGLSQLVVTKDERRSIELPSLCVVSSCGELIVACLDDVFGCLPVHTQSVEQALFLLLRLYRQVDLRFVVVDGRVGVAGWRYGDTNDPVCVIYGWHEGPFLINQDPIVGTVSLGTPRVIRESFRID